MKNKGTVKKNVYFHERIAFLMIYKRHHKDENEKSGMCVCGGGFCLSGEILLVFMPSTF